MKLKLRISIKTLGTKNKCNYSTNSIYHDNSSKLVVSKMKDETAGVGVEEFVGLKPKMYLYLVDNNSERKNDRAKTKIFLLQ